MEEKEDWMTKKVWMKAEEGGRPGVMAVEGRGCLAQEEEVGEVLGEEEAGFGGPVLGWCWFQEGFGFGHCCWFLLWLTV